MDHFNKMSGAARPNIGTAGISVIVFSSNANAWQTEFLTANADNKKRAIDYVNSLNDDGGKR